uniref:Salicylate hydroxylase protein n=1 Tax=Fulvimarina pelagi TaxID=217511 RepID=A0A0P0ZAQ3_9HYPH|nr:salicylate hydroxylase protein [Fulvimarina pelagi]
MIVGAGIAGLTTALALARHGISSTIFERAETLNEVGAGLQIPPNALRVLTRLGLTERLRPYAVSAISVTLRAGKSGRKLAAVPVGSGLDAPYFSMHRADLQSVLLDAVRVESLIHLESDRELVALTASSRGVDAEFVSANGERAHSAADLVVAADGVNSRVASLNVLSPATFAGAIAWRARVTGKVALDFNARSGGITAWLGPARHAVAYPIRFGNETNLVLVEKAGAEHAAGGETVPRGFSNWDAVLRRLIDEAGAFTPWPLLTAPAERPWVMADRRTVLIGDAAHAILPYAAQGAAMAIEDGFVLARTIYDDPDINAALGLFEAQRRERVARVAARARFHRFVYHLPPPLSLGRDLVMAAMPPSRLQKSLAWLYDWDLADSA